MAKRQIFYSFHYENDAWRAAQIRNIGAIEGNKPVSENDWEEVKRKGDAAVKKWIDDNMKYRSCVIVLVGEETANRKWVQYEIKKAWREGKGLVGIHIHNLLNEKGYKSNMGSTPFYNAGLYGEIKCYDPPCSDSKKVYAYIKEHLEDWIEEAIEIRNLY
ncbi:MAG: TIR domain-containing protein [Dysgonamonadaceae bacterium]|jgi:hypothetical protein|nr:TIR domain-containing protein [Dysgonamonadaceae bacterium]